MTVCWPWSAVQLQATVRDFKRRSQARAVAYLTPAAAVPGRCLAAARLQRGVPSRSQVLQGLGSTKQ